MQKGDLCKMCKTNPIYCHFEKRLKREQLVQWCSECIVKTKDDVTCMFCHTFIAQSFGDEWAGDGDVFKCCDDCMTIIARDASSRVLKRSRDEETKEK